MMTVQIDASRLMQAGAKLPGAIRTEFGDALDHISLKFLKKFRDDRLSGGQGIKARPGGLFRRFTRVFKVPTATQSMGVEIFTYSKIAELHEKGGTMASPDGLRLAVPISASGDTTETSTGAVRAKYGGTAYNRDLRTLKNLRVVNIGGNIYLFRAKKRGADNLPPLFVLKSEVKLKPRLGFYQEWQDMIPDTVQIANQAITKACNEAWS